jgi:hypothetical protein
LTTGKEIKMNFVLSFPCHVQTDREIARPRVSVEGKTNMQRKEIEEEESKEMKTQEEMQAEKKGKKSTQNEGRKERNGQRTERNKHCRIEEEAV